jgi:hypothetical protein
VGDLLIKREKLQKQRWFSPDLARRQITAIG